MSSFLLTFQNVDLLSVGIAVAGMVILGFIVLFNDYKSISSRIFFCLSITAATWGVINYLSYQPYSLEISFWLLRFVLFFAVWASFFTLAFALIFPEEKPKLSFKFKWLLIPITAFTALITLTPLVFSKASEVTDGRITRIVNGPGILFFAASILSINLGSIISLLRRIRRSKEETRKPLKIVLEGIIVMLALIITFNLVLPAFLENTRFIPLGALFLFPFIAFTSYAIMRHKLFNVRVAGTGLLVFALAVLTFIEVIFAGDVGILVYRSSVFILVLVFGVLLIKGVLREVEQREELQVLSKKLEEANLQLQALDKARAEFISIASHQLRTPPATIKWYVGAIMDGDFGPLSSELKASLQRVESTNNSQISLIDDLLNASRIERGKLEFFFEMGDVTQLAKITCEQLQPQATMHKLKLEFKPPAQPLPQVMVDKEKVRQVINNFIDNAIKYTKQGGITVTLEQTPTDVVVKVTDTGRGVAQDVAPSLFEKYTRGKDAASAASGLGLGLYVAKVVIEQNNGKIWVESPGEGKGSTFAFSLPIHSTLEATSTVDLAQEQTSKPAEIISSEPKLP